MNLSEFFDQHEATPEEQEELIVYLCVFRMKRLLNSLATKENPQ